MCSYQCVSRFAFGQPENRFLSPGGKYIKFVVFAQHKFYGIFFRGQPYEHDDDDEIALREVRLASEWHQLKRNAAFRFHLIECTWAYS